MTSPHRRSAAYEPIEDYALLADTHSAALVSRRGSIDWLCLPRFDSPALFCALLDKDAGGGWTLAPVDEPLSIRRAYRPDSMVLETTFTCRDGTVTVVDALALEGRAGRHPETHPDELLLRVVRGVEGTVALETQIAPRFAYGESVPWFRTIEQGWQAVAGPDAVDIRSTVPLQLDGASRALRGRFSVSANEERRFLVSYHRAHEPVRRRAVDDVDRACERTDRFWRAWARRCRYEGPWRDEVVRSLLTLKALIYAPSGGIVAAPTTSLPERLGGRRNWDYRYCWLRDATFALDALIECGYTDEAAHWVRWLLHAVAGDPEDMQLMYGVLGERRLWEHELPWLEGYEGAEPVRIGNAAHEQFQLDVYGELMDAFHSARRAGLDLPPEAWDLQKVVAGFVCDRWREPDNGIWEVRSPPEHFVHSKVMAWVALDRAVKAAQRFGDSDGVGRWRAVMQDIRSEVMDRGVHPDGRFRRAYGSDELDASLLMLPIVGFVDANDPLMTRTVEAIRDELTVDGLLLRYRTDRAPDGLPPGEAPFLMVSFWLVDILALQGRLGEARALFARLASIVNDVGLLSEEYDPRTGRFLGNFPQAFSHVALVTAAKSLETVGEARSIHRGR